MSQTPQEQLRQAIGSHAIAVVQIGSEQCQPCHAIRSKLEDWSHRHPKAAFLYFSRTQAPQMCAQLGIYSVPTVLVYVKGKLSLRESGYFSLNEILEKTEHYEQLLCME